jgi:hypothetical protein
MIDEHDAERDGTGGQRAAGEPEPSEALSAGELVTADELELAEDAVLGEAERALLRWALRQRELAPGEPLLPTRNEPLQPAETPAPTPAPTPAAQAAPTPAPGPKPEAAPGRADDRHPSAPKQFHGSAEEAISALVAAGGPDPRDFASPRLDRRTKLVIALALVVLFLVSVLGGFVGYRVTHRAAGGWSEPVGRPAGIHAGPAAPAEAGM